MKLDLHYMDERLVELHDLGCGTGILTRALATSERRVIGVDPSAHMLKVAQRAT